MVRRRRLTDVGRVLEAAEAASPVEAVEGVARELGLAFDAVAVSFLIADLSGRALVRLAHVPLVPGRAADTSLVAGERREDEESATVLPFDGGPAEQAVRTQTVQVLPPAARDGAWCRGPVAGAGAGDRARGVHRPAGAVPARGTRPRRVAEIAQVAHLLAFVVIANRRHTDLFEWGQRSRRFSLSAEIQQRLLPESRTCEAAAFTLAGWLEPAASIGGDTFDYSLARDVLHLSLTDAMGHGVDAALTAAVCLGRPARGRRRGASLLEQASATNHALSEHAVSAAATTSSPGCSAGSTCAPARIELVNAGHVAPYLAPRLRADRAGPARRPALRHVRRHAPTAAPG